MSIRKIIGMENGVEDFKLQVAPRSILVPKNSKAFRLYLQKGDFDDISGMQVLGRFQNDPNLTLKESFYRFRNAHPVQFRLASLNHPNYTWSLYLINPQTLQQTFVDSASFNIERTIKLYQMEFLDKEREIQTSFRQRTITRAMVLELWNKAKKEMKTCKSIQKCVFSNQDYQIQFQVEIKNNLDDEVEKMIIEKQHRPSLKRQKSDDFSSNGSELRGKQEHSQIKPRPGESSNAIQISFSPYKASQAKGDEINTKQTIELETPDHHLAHESRVRQQSEKIKEVTMADDFNATVKIVNPSGEQIQANKQEQNQNARKRSYSDSSSGSNRQYPMKKFSLLSDIIEMSYEGSSSYGNPQHSSSNGFNRDALRKDGTMDYVIEHEGADQAHGLNKFKTLPYESHHHHRLEVRDEFRRALTTEKHQNDYQSSQMHEQSVLSVNDGNENQKQSECLKPKQSSGDPNGKWIILVAILIILGIISGALMNEGEGGNPLRKKSKKRRQIN